MNIAILSRKASLYSTRRLKEAALARGHTARIIDYLRCTMDITSHKPRVILAGERLEGFDAIIPRIGASRTFYGTAVVRQFEMMGVFSANESQAITRSRDKLRSLQLLARAGIGLPVTAFADSTKDVDGVCATVGGAPLVVKLIEGTRRIGVVLCETRQAASSVIEAFRGLEANLLVQEYIAEAGGMDLRCLVVGDRVIAAVRRQAVAGELRGSLRRGGTPEVARITPAERSTAVRAARAMGLNVAAVDLLRSQRGPVVIEVNCSPELKGIEAATGKDVAGDIIAFLESHARPGRTRDRVKG